MLIILGTKQYWKYSERVYCWDHLLDLEGLYGTENTTTVVMTGPSSYPWWQNNENNIGLTSDAINI
jgi:hypothetical protein